MASRGGARWIAAAGALACALVATGTARGQPTGLDREQWREAPAGASPAVAGAPGSAEGQTVTLAITRIAVTIPAGAGSWRVGRRAIADAGREADELVRTSGGREAQILVGIVPNAIACQSRKADGLPVPAPDPFHHATVTTKEGATFQSLCADLPGGRALIVTTGYDGPSSDPDHQSVVAVAQAVGRGARPLGRAAPVGAGTPGGAAGGYGGREDRGPSGGPDRAEPPSRKWSAEPGWELSGGSVGDKPYPGSGQGWIAGLGISVPVTKPMESAVRAGIVVAAGAYVGGWRRGDADPASAYPLPPGQKRDSSNDPDKNATMAYVPLEPGVRVAVGGGAGIALSGHYSPGLVSGGGITGVTPIGYRAGASIYFRGGSVGAAYRHVGRGGYPAMNAGLFVLEIH